MRRLLCAAIFFAGTIGAAHAIDFTQTIKTFDGKDFVDTSGKTAPQVLGTVAENSLLATAPNESVDEKTKDYLLAVKIHEHPKHPALSAEEIARIKKAIGTYQPTAIMGQAFQLIDPASLPKN